MYTYIPYMPVCFKTFSLAFEKRLLDQHALVVQLNEFGTQRTLEHSINKNRNLLSVALLWLYAALMVFKCIHAVTSIKINVQWWLK